eukprot:gene10141-2306_t
MCTNVRLTTSPFSVLDSFTLVVNVVGAFRDVRFFSWPIFHTIARIGISSCSNPSLPPLPLLSTSSPSIHPIS